MKSSNFQNMHDELPKEVQLAESFLLADNVLMKKYLSNLDQYEIVPIPKESLNVPVVDTTRFFHINRIVYDKEENNQEKLLSIYHALYTCGGSAILLLKCDKKKIDFYMGTKANSSDQVVTCQDILNKAVKGNFPGTKMERLRNQDVKALISEVFDTKEIAMKKSIAAVTSIASFREGHTMKSGDFVQGLEKLLDSVRGEEFSLMVLANPISPVQIEIIRSGYENLYSQLLPFASTDMTYGENEVESLTNSITKGLSEGITSSVAQTTSYSHSEGTSHTVSDTKGHSESNGRAFNFNLGGSLGKNVAKNLLVGLQGGIGIKKIFNVGGSVARGLTTGIAKGLSSAIGGAFSMTETDSESHTDTTGQTSTNTKTEGKTTLQGTTHTETNTTGQSTTVGAGRSISYLTHTENRSVKTLLNRIDTQLQRFDECMDLGMWDTAAYVIADDARTGQVVASAYQALIRGKNSGLENSAVTVWGNEKKSDEVAAYLRRMEHPIFVEDLDSPVLFSPAAMISGEELTVAAGFPQQSLPGLPVRNFAKFGRDIVKHESEARKLKLGQIYHMGEIEEADAVLDMDALTAHTFVTGSTGSGKSNTVYKILHELYKKKVPWLVIEPAKGEYKETFGGFNDVVVYGTNPYKVPNLLQINPFSFPKDVHVLEHIDRLVEIFNACWPMYAAMPSILREAMEKSYESCGWSLRLSKNPGEFPTFDTLLSVLPSVVKSSSFSDDTSNDYTGALVTRVRSLTRGIHGMIFKKDTDSEKLFQNTAIVDLSRVGSQETKSLIMGILVLKLSEFRMSEDMGSNSGLRHITVIEEAHNLLRRTSTEQPQESPNLQGQSVSMLANAIAEMRTYGEGFIITDQSPGLLDMAVIRNTNTKIVLRLPEATDREIVGKSMGLNDVQIEELADLDRGVAGVFQSDWTEPILCQIECFKKGKSLKERDNTTDFSWFSEEILIPKKFLKAILVDEIPKFNEEETIILRKWYQSWNPGENATIIFEKGISGKKLSDKHKAVVLKYATGDVLRRSYRRDDIISLTKQALIGKYDFDVNDEVFPALNSLYNRVLPEDLMEIIKNTNCERGKV